MGANFDTELNRFTEKIIQIMQSSLTLPPRIKVSVKINRLCRAICGHILAAKNYYDDVCLIDKNLRKYVLDDYALPPKNMALLYWIYPYSTISIVRDVGVQPYSNKYEFPKGTISIMNSFPVAYIVSTDKEKCGLFDMFSVCSNDLDDIVEIPVDCNSCYFPNSKLLRPFLWPCNVTDDETGAAFVLGNDKAMDDSKIAKHSTDSVNKIRNRRKTNNY